MRRLTRTAIGAALALLTVGVVATPGVAAVPGPRQEQWWFTVWAVQNKVWPITQGQGVTVAVLDKGVQASIPDLQGVVLPGTDAETGGGDGRTDVDDAAPPGHGTGMAALIASQGRATGFVGVAPKAKILPIVMRHLDAVASAIRYAVDHGAKVINISQVAPTRCPDDAQQAVSYAIQHDVVVVAGAGNDGDTTNFSNTPANCAGVLAVGGLDPQLRAFVKTQRQPYVAVSAPATGVGSVLRDGRYYTSEGGTSSATALTSAVVALVRAKFPNLSAREVVQRIIASTRDAGPPGRDEQTGYGAVRPYQALTMDVPKSTPNPVFAAYDKWAAAHGVKGGSNSSAQKKSADSGSDLRGLLLPVGVIAALLLLIVVLVLFMRSRNRRTAASTPMAGYPGPGQPQQWGGQQGPPSGFGPPPAAQPQQGPRPGAQPQQGSRPGPPPSFGPPQGGQVPPPGQEGGRRPSPSFEPPDQGPPEGRRHP